MRGRKSKHGELICKTVTTTYLSNDDYYKLLRICSDRNIKITEYVRNCIVRQLKEEIGYDN